MAFKDYSAFMLPPLTLPFNGKDYVIPKPSLETGLRLTRGIADEGGELFSADVETQWALVLGTAYDEMKADGVPVEFVSRAFLTALADFQGGRVLAEATWEVGTDPEALTAWLQAKQAQLSDETTSTSTDEATETR